MLELKKCHPIELNDLIRIGRIHDGGYVISSRQIEKTEMILSFGICDDWSFEEEFEKKRNRPVLIYSYDYSIKNNYFVSPSIKSKCKHITKMIVWFLLGNKKRIRSHQRLINLKYDFRNFFYNHSHHHYIPKFLGVRNDTNHICFQSIIDNLQTDKLSVFIKMDIEGDEYKCLQDIMPHANIINGIAVEFHALDIYGEKFEELVRTLSAEFYICHIHGNNCSQLIQDTNIPKVLEITFINKRLVDDVHLSRRKYPINGLDYPCNPEKEDYILDFK